MNQEDNGSNLKEEKKNIEKPKDSCSKLVNTPTLSPPARIIRKLPESRKLPFQRNHDDTTAGTSSRLINESEGGRKINSSTVRPSNYSFNFNAIKSRFSDQTNEPSKNKKRQFDGIKGDSSTNQNPSKTYNSTESKSSFLNRNKSANNLSSQSESETKDDSKNVELLNQSADYGYMNQSESKRQKPDLELVQSEIREEPNTTTDVCEPKERYVSIIKTPSPELLNQIENDNNSHKHEMEKRPDQTIITNKQESMPTTSSNASASYITKVKITTDSKPEIEQVNMNVDTSLSQSTINDATKPIVNNQIDIEMPNAVEDSGDDSDVDLSSITLHKSFIEQRELEKSKKNEEKNKSQAYNNPTTSKETEHKDSDENVKNSSQENSSDESAPREPLTDPNDPEYWERIYESSFYKSRSLNFNDIVNREFGFAGRMGHGNRNNFFRDKGILKPKLIYNQQIQSSREYVMKAMNNLNNVRRMKLTHTLAEHDGCVNALNFNKTGNLLLSGSDDYRVCIWDWPKSNVVLQYESGHKSNVFQTKFVPFSGDLQIVTCARDGQVRLGLISSSGTYLGTKKLAKHADSCHKLAIESDSPNLFLSCGEDGAVYEIDLRQNTPAKILTIKNHLNNYRLPLYSIHSNPSDTYQFIVTGRDPYIRMYDKRMLVKDKTQILKKFCPEHLKDSQRSSITSAVFNYNGTEIIGSYSDDDIYLYETNQEENDKAKYRYKGHRNSDTVKGVSYYGSTDDFIISGSDCGRIFFWEKTSQQIVNVLKGDESGIVNVLEPHPSFPYLATSGLDSDIKIWSPTSEEPNKLENLTQIIQENQRVRETSRHFSLSSFEFELLLLLMHRPNNRVLVGSAGDNSSLSDHLNALGETRGLNESNEGQALFGPFRLRRRQGFPGTGAEEDEDREFSPVDDDDGENEYQSDTDGDEDDEEDNFINFDEEEYDNDTDSRDTTDSVHLLNYYRRRQLPNESRSSNTTINYENSDNTNDISIVRSGSNSDSLNLPELTNSYSHDDIGFNDT